MPRGMITKFVLLFIVAICAGCDSAGENGVSTSSSAPQGNDADDLRALRQVYIDYLDAYGQGPADWEAALEFAKLSDTYNPEAIERLRDAGCQVTWSAKMTDAAVSGVDNYQIAALPGGPRLMISGAIVE
jgi:hypothetical protein